MALRLGPASSPPKPHPEVPGEVRWPSRDRLSTSALHTDKLTQAGGPRGPRPVPGFSCASLIHNNGQYPKKLGTVIATSPSKEIEAQRNESTCPGDLGGAWNPDRWEP